jgi:hypothetical protein
MFDSKKIFDAIRNLEKAKERGEISAREFELESKKINTFVDFWLDRHHGFEPANPSIYGEKIKQAKTPGFTLDTMFLLDGIVEHAMIIPGSDNQVNLFLIISDNDWTYSVSTNRNRNECDKYFAVRKAERALLFQTVSPVETEDGYIFQGSDLGFRGTILECFERFELIRMCLPDLMTDGHMRWSRENIKFLHSLIDEPDLVQILATRLASKASA